jgi:cob(I)alamin adenosyltransferase
MEHSITTKKGDSGVTNIFVHGKLIKARKDSAVIEAVGAVDELNCYIGEILSKLNINIDYRSDVQPFVEVLNQIQDALFRVGSELSTGEEYLNESHITILESAQTDVECAITPIKNFILPRGCELAVKTHLTRAICRRAERRVVTAIHGNPGLFKDPNLSIQYLNRLSDYLFQLARYFNREKGDTPWKP